MADRQARIVSGSITAGVAIHCNPSISAPLLGNIGAQFSTGPEPPQVTTMLFSLSIRFILSRHLQFIIYRRRMWAAMRYRNQAFLLCKA